MRIEERTPLNWPEGWPRTKPGSRGTTGFGKHTISAAIDYVCGELKRLGCESAVISANAFLRGTPSDTGVAVYFTLKGQKRVLACDRWVKIEHNFWAVGKHIEALRGQQRWGVGTIDQAFQGYTAIPEKSGGTAWYETLGVAIDASEEQIRAAYRQKAALYHPDVGGSHKQMSEINAAYEGMMAAVKARQP